MSQPLIHPNAKPPEPPPSARRRPLSTSSTTPPSRPRSSGPPSRRTPSTRRSSATAPGGTEYSWQQLPEAVKALEAGEDINYMGASGPVDMDENGDASASTSTTGDSTSSP
jgi:hypothetical protein